MAALQYERQMQDEKREMREAMADALRRDAAALGIDPAKLQEEYTMSRADLKRGTGKPKRTKAGVAPTHETGSLNRLSAAAESATPPAEDKAVGRASGDAALKKTEATPAEAPAAVGPDPDSAARRSAPTKAAATSSQNGNRVRRHLSGAEKRNACLLRDSGWTFDAIGRHLGIAHASRADRLDERARLDHVEGGKAPILVVPLPVHALSRWPLGGEEASGDESI